MKSSRLLFDLGPLIIFFVAYKFAGIFWATGIFMVAASLALLLGWLAEKRLRVMPLVTLVLVLVLGGLTLYLGDSTFIKMKPTVVYLVFAVILGGGIIFDQYYLKFVFDGAFHLPDQAWRVLTWRWVAFFSALAVVNEIVWRNFSESMWVNFKVFGILPLVFGFALANTPFMLKYMPRDNKPSE